MTTVPDTTTTVNTVQFDAALRGLAARARERYAGEHLRLERGLLLALNGHVTLHQDGTASVRSGTDAEIVYTVNGHCDCPDASRAPDGRCKHRWAVCFVRKAQRELAAQAAAHTYYATWTHDADDPRYGVATLTLALGWLFTEEGSGRVFPALACELDLHGNVAVLAGQEVAS